MELSRSVIWVVIAVMLWATCALAWVGYFKRYTTNTAGGRFYRTDNWSGITTVIEKDGTQRHF